VEKRRRACALTEESIGLNGRRERGSVARLGSVRLDAAWRDAAWRGAARLGATQRGLARRSVAVGVAGRRDGVRLEGRGLSERCPCREPSHARATRTTERHREHDDRRDG